MWANRIKEYFDAPHELERAQRISGAGGSENGEAAQNSSCASEQRFLFGPQRLQHFMRQSGLSYRETRNIFTRFCIVAVAAIVLMALVRSALPILLLLANAAVEYSRIRRRIRARAVDFERDYTAFLLSLASAVRTGLDPLVAALQSDELFADGSELRKELVKFKCNIDRGMGEEQAIMEFAGTIDHPDVQLFRTAFILARREGSSLSLCLQRLARVTRQRQSFRRKVRAAVAMQKLSSIGIAGCAVVVGLFQSFANPAAIREAFNHPFGFKLLACGLFFMTLGLVWMMRMTRSRM